MTELSFPTLFLELFDAAIFELEGVVINTAGVQATAWKQVLDRYLADCTTKGRKSLQPFDEVADYRDYFVGKSESEGVKRFLESRGLTLPAGTEEDGPDLNTLCGLLNRKNFLFQEVLKEQRIGPWESTVTVIREWRGHGKKTAVVSAGSTYFLEITGLGGLFDAKIDGQDAARLQLQGKPLPDVFLKAAELLGVSPDRGVVFENSPEGVLTGRAGNFGMVVGVDRTGHAQTLKHHGADLIVSDLVELALREGNGHLRRNIRALPSALEYTEDILHSINAKRLVCFLDYDGTLTPIVAKPELAFLSEDMRRTLKALADFCTVGVISGRDRQEVQRLVNLDSLIYAGSHGFDIAGPHRWQVQHEVGSQFLPTLDQAEAALRARVGAIPGVVIERKKYSVAVHYRLVSAQDWDVVGEAVRAVGAEQPTLRKKEGKKVYELQPQLDWDKGKALLWIFDALKLPKDQIFPFYLGDDLTDEDAFYALQNFGIGIVSDEVSRFSYAQYRLRDPDEVHYFLKTVVDFFRGQSR